MDIRQLRYFLSVVQAGSVTRAAVTLGIAQPALSKQISLLERELGASLLIRTSRGVELTGAGSVLAASANEILAKLAQTRSEIQSHADDLVGSVSLGFYPNQSLAATHLAPLILAVRSSHPRVEIRVHEAIGSVLEEWIAIGRINVGILTWIPPRRELNVVELNEEELVLVYAPDPTDPEPQTYALSDLATLPLILPDRGAHLRDHLEAVVAKLAIPLRIDLVMNSPSMMKELAKQGAGYTILPRQMVKEDIRNGSLAAARIDDADLKLSIVCVTAATRSLSPAAEMLRNEIVSHWSGLENAGLA